MQNIAETDIAIIGISGKFPDSKNFREYWKNLKEGKSTILKSNDIELKKSGTPKDILDNPRFVNASSKLKDAASFDADFFDMSAVEALNMDPQIRLLLENSWHAIEDAGYNVDDITVPVGNFCGMSVNTYLMRIIASNSKEEHVDALMYRILNDKDFLATWVSYKLNLIGPAMSIQTACSSSLLAVHMACQSLLNRECDLALASGSSFDSNEPVGYLYTSESIYSKDGVCRPFDKNATGTVHGDGVGTVLLKRAEEAYKDGDHIYALIKGTATNNDGANKQTFTAPSLNAQRDVILEALAVADIDPETIGMIEAHGTGTFIGDPVEVAALTEAFREYTSKNQYCALSSVKGNIGHLDAASGIASLIKAVCCVYEGVLIPNINYSEPNPALHLSASPFFISQDLMQWPEQFEIKRAGISSLGVGGTNVHVIIEEPPKQKEIKDEEREYLFALSSKTALGLEQTKKAYLSYFETNQKISLTKLENTVLYGRKSFQHRESIVFKNIEDLKEKIKNSNETNTYLGKEENCQIIFLFPGQGSQFVKMGYTLYCENSFIKEQIDYCFDYLKLNHGLNFKEILFSEDLALLNETQNTQLALFVVEYAICKWLNKFGVKPDAIIGHSLGEYVGACILGYFSLEDALKMVFHRGKLMGQMPKGSMLLVNSDWNELKEILLEGVEVSVYNSKNHIVLGGDSQLIEKQSLLLSERKIQNKKLKVSHAYHTQMMTNAVSEYEKILSEIDFKEGELFMVSTLTGDFVPDNQLAGKEYWLKQITNPVKFYQAVETIGQKFNNPVFIEVGPGSGLSFFLKETFGNTIKTVQTLKPISEDTLSKSLQDVLADYFVKGGTFKTTDLDQRSILNLPGYVFSKNRFWKPKTAVNHDNFGEIRDSFHYENEAYQKDRFRSSIEIKLDKNNEISDEKLSQLNHLHSQYMKDLKALFPESNLVNDSIEALYKELVPDNEDSFDASKWNDKRKFNDIYVEPTSDTEKIIAEYWGNVLGYSPVGILDNYFEAGGNSLFATKLLTQLSDEFEITLLFKELSKSVTIKELAVLIESKVNINELVGSIEMSDNDENYLEL